MYYIYQIKNLITGDTYIGKNKDFKKRKKQHIKYSKMEFSDRKNYPLYVSMRNYNLENFDFSILYVCDDNIEAAELEKNLIKEKEPMLNRTKGGEGSKGIDDLSVVKLYEELKIIKKVAETLNIHVDSVRNVLRKNGVNTETEFVRNLMKIKIYSYDLNTGAKIKTYSSLSAASLDICGNKNMKSAIRKCIDNKTKSCYGMGWKEE